MSDPTVIVVNSDSEPTPEPVVVPIPIPVPVDTGPDVMGELERIKGEIITEVCAYIDEKVVVPEPIIIIPPSEPPPIIDKQPPPLKEPDVAPKSRSPKKSQSLIDRWF